MENIDFCIEYLKKYNSISHLPDFNKHDAFRALLNVTMPINLSEEFYEKQDATLQEFLSHEEIIDVDSLSPIKNNIYLYYGDITLLKIDAIVNAANSKLLGCFQPLHNCIDNAIHSYAGLQLRRDLMEIMNKQGSDERNGDAKITKGYNLPSKYVIHTVGPIVMNKVSKQNEIDLYNCYHSCLKLADENKLSSIAFCSISTGLYGYPILEASKTAIKAINDYLKNENKNIKKVVIDVFSQKSYEIYKELLTNG